ncbi:hypothetical protein BDQ17DRAFT_819875 [Cyathus striatus]|nr:hypothetical protein BDQ17DRAFT_819875 [Cyathus striatus]
MVDEAEKAPRRALSCRPTAAGLKSLHNMKSSEPLFFGCSHCQCSSIRMNLIHPPLRTPPRSQLYIHISIRSSSTLMSSNTTLPGPSADSGPRGRGRGRGGGGRPWRSRGVSNWRGRGRGRGGYASGQLGTDEPRAQQPRAPRPTHFLALPLVRPCLSSPTGTTSNTTRAHSKTTQPSVQKSPLSNLPFSSTHLRLRGWTKALL